VTVVRARSVDGIKTELLALLRSPSALSLSRAPSSPKVAVRSSVPDERALSLLPEGTVVLVLVLVLVPDDFGTTTTQPPATAAAAVSKAKKATAPTVPSTARTFPKFSPAAAGGDEDEDDYDSSVHGLVLSRWATMRDVVNEQRGNGEIRHSCFPFLTTASLDKPVLSALFRDNDPRYPQNYFQRSSSKPLDRVQSFTYLPLSALDPSGIVETRWSKAEGVPTPTVDDKLVLEATFRADPDEATMQVRRAVYLYDPGVFDQDIVGAFQKNYGRALHEKKLDGVDVTVEVLNKPAYVTSLMVVVVTATSTTGGHDAALDALFPGLLRKSQQSLLMVDPLDIHQMETPLADRRGAFNLPSRESGGTMKVSDAAGFFSWLKAAVLAASNEKNPNLQAFFRLVPEDGRMYANVVVFEAENEAVGPRAAAGSAPPKK
jgi:hypothetical protein